MCASAPPSLSPQVKPTAKAPEPLASLALSRPQGVQQPAIAIRSRAVPHTHENVHGHHRNQAADKAPRLYRVLLLNDDFTPMDFVVDVLEHLFHKDHEAAQRIMMTVHQRGLGECGVFTYEVAETKVMLVIDLARKNGYPLKCVMEKT